MKTQVLIVGAGPIGLMAGLLLSNQGISSIIVDRRFERMTAPKAHAVNPRTIEICDAAGLSGHALRAHGSPVELAGSVRFASKLSGTRFGELPYERQTDKDLDITPFPLINISQPQFEAQLAAQIQTKDNVGLLRGAECREILEEANGIRAQVFLRGAQEPLEIGASYVLSADGAGSRTRDALGITMEGPETLQNYVMIHCKGDLSDITGDQPGVLYFTFDPEASGAFIFYDDMTTWVFMKSYDPSTESAEDFDEERCRGEVLNAIGHDNVQFSVENISPWRMSSQMASAYRKGRIFLIGDAAHRFPPTGGLGLNTGAGDAQNISWKLAKVLKGEASERLLDTYEIERRPVAVDNSEQSMTNAAKMFELFSVLYGEDPSTKMQHFASMCEAGADDERIQAAIEIQRPHFDSIKLQLGYRYHSEALIGSKPIDRAPDDDISNYKPSYDVGALLPHEWVQNGADRSSLLSLLSSTEFSLIGRSEKGRAVAEELSNDIRYISAPATWADKEDLAGVVALLIRPDGHIAARYGETASAEAVRRDLNTILSRED